MRLLYASARWPDQPEKSRKGRTKTAAASGSALLGAEHAHRVERHDDLEDVVVERAEELRPEKRLQARDSQRRAIGAVRHCEADNMPSLATMS